MARVSLVACINVFGANQLNTFSVQLGAHQIINWCVPINYLNYSTDFTKWDRFFISGWPALTLASPSLPGETGAELVTPSA